MDKNKVFGEKNFLKGLAMCTPWKKFGQKTRNFEIFFGIINFYSCLYRVKAIFWDRYLPLLLFTTSIDIEKTLNIFRIVHNGKLTRNVHESSVT